MENYWIKKNEQARINIRVHISWLDPSGFNTTAHVSVKSTWSSCWAESEHFHGFFLRCAGIGGWNLSHFFLFEWLKFKCDSARDACMQCIWLACPAPLAKRTPHNCELSFLWTAMDPNGRRIRVWDDLALHLCHCHCMTICGNAKQWNSKMESWCSFCNVRDASIWRKRSVWWWSLRNFTASWYLKPLENMFVSWPED